MSNKPVFARREFLTKLTTAVSGSATLAIVPSLVQAAPMPRVEPRKKTETPKAKGYQRTEHVDTYYHLADF
jgi:hypothetical protein